MTPSPAAKPSPPTSLPPFAPRGAMPNMTDESCFGGRPWSMAPKLHGTPHRVPLCSCHLVPAPILERSGVRPTAWEANVFTLRNNISVVQWRKGSQWFDVERALARRRGRRRRHVLPHVPRELCRREVLHDGV
ncbi:hypothetical protein BAE44_0018284 [Dichanthelium oligosanthes]|uniref:Uncharacterized protein n=1 Tax=Dichanthelium oligosanthes TaxID=888268 RepID=A0A1E5V6K3_9POAL|nr:hypothetical protein BAE44_0018284 [Dichanthelium oligosanthes]